MKKIFRKRKLQIRFFLAYLTIALLVTGAFSIFFYRYTSQILIRRETKALADLNTSFISAIDQILSDMNTVSVNICYSDQVIGSLDTNLTESYASFRSLIDTLVSINGIDVKVDQMNIYDFEGTLAQVGIRTAVTTVDIDSLDWIDEVRGLDGGKYLTLPYQTNNLAYNSNTYGNSQTNWYVSLLRTYRDDTKKQAGVIETIKNCQSIFYPVSSYIQKTENAPQVFIYDSQGSLVYPYGNASGDPAEFPDYFTAAQVSEETSRYRNPADGTRSILAASRSSFSGWTYVAVQQEAVVLSSVKQLGLMLLGFIGLMLLFSAFLSWHLSKGLLLPIRKLQGIISKTELETLGENPKAPLGTSIDELKELNLAFQNMQKKLKASMDDLLESRQQELKSRSLALQSQINPHFYYNTLSNIIVLAEDGQTDEVIAMCRSLTRIMRYITGTGSSVVTLDAEISYIRQYLYCMKVRYQSSLNYEIQIDDAIREEAVPKLIIQPLVENALKYGTVSTPPWFLLVKGEIDGDFWTVTVTDSGNGFSKESLELIRTRMEKADANPGMPEMQLGGMGLLNVYLRWKLFCGGDAVFVCRNTEDGHGQILIGRRRKKNGDL